MTKETVLTQFSPAFWKHEYSASIKPDEAISAMQEYADLRCKPLVEALEMALNYLNAGEEIYPRTGIHNAIEKALQDYKK